MNGLDPQGIIQIRELILKLNREQSVTVLISSHILDELSRLATHYGFIDNGHMIREMSAKELEEACRKCVRVEVSNMMALALVLDQMVLHCGNRTGLYRTGAFHCKAIDKAVGWNH